MEKNGDVRASEDQDQNYENEAQGTQSTSPKTYSPVLLVTLASIIASIGGILFGYDIGIISGALLLLKKEFHLTCFEQEIIVSAVLIGALFASLVGGNIVDHCGRKSAIILSTILFIGGALILSFSFNINMIIVGRLIVGAGVSLSVTAECTYISEISPPNRRGTMVSLNEVGITVGFLLAYLCNYLFIYCRNGWRYMFGAATVPALVQAAGVLFIPQSPHYLILKGKPKEAEIILKRLRQNNAEEEMKSISLALEEEKNRRYIDLFSSENNMRARMTLGMVLVFFQQFSGHANVLYYAPSVFQFFGYCSDASATLITVGLGVVKVVSTCFTLVIVDKFGRRLLLLVGCISMATSIFVLGITATVNQQQISTVKCSSEQHRDITSNTSLALNTVLSKGGYQNLTPALEVSPPFGDLLLDVSNHQSGKRQTNHSFSDQLLTQYSTKNNTNGSESMYWNNTMEEDSTCPSGSQMSFVMKLISVISLMTFVCAYGVSYGPVTWLVLSEIFPTALRGRAISVATCVNWGSNIIVSVTFLDLLGTVGVGETFLLYSCICAGAAVFVFMCIPETKNKTLEEITCQLRKGFLQKKINNCALSLTRKYSVSQENVR